MENDGTKQIICKYCKSPYTQFFINFCDYIKKKEAMFSFNLGNTEIVTLKYLEMDGYSGQELRDYCKKINKIYPKELDWEEQKKYWVTQTIIFKEKRCPCE
jgi:hypothetical protein